MDRYYLVVLYLLYGSYIALFFAAAVTDVWRFVIPNAVVIGALALFPVAALLLPFETDWIGHLSAALLVFALGAALFAFKVLGGGDVKLLTAAALWAGLEHLPDLILIVALFGGGLALILLVLRRIAVAAYVSNLFSSSLSLPQVFVGGPMPYGLAIAAGAIIVGRDLPQLGLFL